MQNLRKIHQVALAALEKIIIAIFIVLVLTVLWNIFLAWLMKMEATRGIINASWNDWCDDYARIFFIWLSMLGSAVAFGVKAHLGVDALVRLFDYQTQSLARIITYMLTLVFAIAILIIGGAIMVNNGRGSMFGTTGISLAMVYLAFPISGIFVVFSSIEAILEEKNPELVQEVE